MKTLVKMTTSTGITITVSKSAKPVKFTALIGMSNGGRYVDEVSAHSYKQAVIKAKASAREDDGYCGIRTHLISLTAVGGKKLYITVSGLIGVRDVGQHTADATFNSFEEAAVWVDSKI